MSYVLCLMFIVGLMSIDWRQQTTDIRQQTTDNIHQTD